MKTTLKRATSLLGLATLAAVWGNAARPAQAQIVMNFDGTTVSNTPAPTTYIQNGIQMVATAQPGSTLFNAGSPTPGYALNQSSPGSLLFTLTSGGTFAADSIDVNTQGVDTVTFTGALAAGGTVSSTFTTNGNSFQTYTPPATFANLQSFTLNYDGNAGVISVDNITLTPTGTAAPAPEPSSVAAFAFMGLGTLGLLLKARKRTANAA